VPVSGIPYRPLAGLGLFGDGGLDVTNLAWSPAGEPSTPWWRLGLGVAAYVLWACVVMRLTDAAERSTHA